MIPLMYIKKAQGLQSLSLRKRVFLIMIKIKSKVAVEKIKITWRKNGPDFLENEMQCNFTEEEVFFFYSYIYTCTV